MVFLASYYIDTPLLLTYTYPQGILCPARGVMVYYREEDSKMLRQTNPKAHQAAQIGARLRRMRRERRLSQADLARQIGIQQSDLSRMEKGEYRVSLDNLFKILSVFDIKASDFFNETPQKARVERPLAREDMQMLHLLRKLSPEGRQEVMEFLDFKLRREQVAERATSSRIQSGEKI